MNKESVIVVTGSAGFIGSCMARHLNKIGYANLILVDDFKTKEKEYNWKSIIYRSLIEREDFFGWVKKEKPNLAIIIHLGARTDTTEFNYAIHEQLNVEYSKDMWNYCTASEIPLIYASSAATYGSGEIGYNDNHDIVDKLQPLNPYGISKNEFDKWVLKQDGFPPFWGGLKFFNVYGPGEYHKGRMASVIFHAYSQIQNGNSVKLFKSHRHDYEDGKQLRDFIYVKDILKVITWMMEGEFSSGLYNLGTGKARSFFDLAKALFTVLNKTPNIEFINMPEDIREKYQYFTEANMQKLRSEHYNEEFSSLEDGVKDYVQNYLIKKKVL